jgi:hypothetical protein
MKQRMTLSVHPRIAQYLQRQAERTGGNVSAYVEAHFAAEALRESVRAHVTWFADNPGFPVDAEAERAAGAG